MITIKNNHNHDHNYDTAQDSQHKAKCYFVSDVM